MLKKIIFFTFISFVTASTFGQSQEMGPPEIVNEILQQISNDDNSIDPDDIEYLIENPIELNTATLEDLRKLFFIDLAVLKSVISFRDSVESIANIEELRFVQGIDKNEIELLLHFIKADKVKKRIFSEDFFTNPQLQSRLRFKQNNNSAEEQTVPAPFNLYWRTKFKTDKIGVNILFDKDPGEQNYFDFVSSHLKLNDIIFFNALIIGDFQIRFGQGITLWNGFGAYKGLNTLAPVFRNPNTSREYLSADEFNYFRGINIRSNLSKYFSTTIYFSSKPIDCNINSATGEINSIIKTGYHVTENEIARKDNVNEISTGIIINYSNPAIASFGLLVNHTRYDLNFSDFKEKNFQNFAVYFNKHFGKLQLASEISNSRNRYSYILSTALSISSKLNFIFSIRNYNPERFQLYTAPFGENTEGTGEKGYYCGIYLNSKKIKIGCYYDYFSISERFQDIALPGYEFAINSTFALDKNSTLNLKFKSKSKESRIDNLYFYQPVNTTVNIGRIELIYNLSKDLRLKTRYELKKYCKLDYTETGDMIFLDFSYRWRKKIKISSRLILFNTDSFYSGIYEYESGLPGTMSNVCLFGKGFRYYSNLQIELLKILHLNLKYSSTNKPYDFFIDEKGQSYFPGNSNQFSAQFDLKL